MGASSGKTYESHGETFAVQHHFEPWTGVLDALLSLFPDLAAVAWAACELLLSAVAWPR
jgi:hypothetical protein